MFHGEKIFWIGIRESEISATGQLFDGSITVFGSNERNNYSYEKEKNIRIDYNKDNNELNSFISETAMKVLRKYPQCKFVLYYPMEVDEYDPIISEHAICMNSSSITDLLENKIYTKLWLSKIIPVIPFTTMLGIELSYDYICDAFPNESSFVIQGTFSCGGSGTWLVSNDDDMKDILSSINAQSIYTVTPFQEKNISVNLHLIIYEKEILLFPASVQIIYENQRHLCYGGADFFMLNQLSENIISKIQQYGEIIGKHLQAGGYRGICGIDFLTTPDEVFFMEVNARFQSSSFLINDTLNKLSLPSLQELHIDSFYNQTSSFNIPALTIEKSFYNYSFHSNMKKQLKYVWEKSKDCPEVFQCIDDNLDWNIPMENNTYLFKLVFSTNIACVSPEYTCRLYNGFHYDFNLLEGIPWTKQIKRFKVLMLNLGIRISKQAIEQLAQNGGVNYEIFYAIDLSVEGKLFLNVPYKVEFSELSPFEVDYINNEYWLNYYERPIARVSVRTNDLLAQQLTKSHICYNEIAYLGVDRLRIHQRNGCFFKEQGMGCAFCDIEFSDQNFSFEDIKEVLQAYISNPAIKHYLVGGGSRKPSDDFSEIIKIVNYIHNVTDKKIYLMSIPPKETKILTHLKEAGVTEVAFNLEIYDRILARKYMPGKGLLSLERYENAFKEAVMLWGKNGNVRSALIVGLEPVDSLLQGVEFLCKLGVSPILSLIKPAERLEHFWAPASDEVLKIWEQTEEICRRYHVPLGPACHFCEDNVLKATLYDNGV